MDSAITRSSVLLGIAGTVEESITIDKIYLDKENDHHNV